MEQRLPDEPRVVEPVDRIGTYRGTWRTALLGTSDMAWLDRTIGYDNLTRWDLGFNEVTPNVAISVETDEEARESEYISRSVLPGGVRAMPVRTGIRKMFDLGASMQRASSEEGYL